jgi:hypothetical protein
MEDLDFIEYYGVDLSILIDVIEKISECMKRNSSFMKNEKNFSNLKMVMLKKHGTNLTNNCFKLAIMLITTSESVGRFRCSYLEDRMNTFNRTYLENCSLIRNHTNLVNELKRRLKASEDEVKSN